MLKRTKNKIFLSVSFMSVASLLMAGCGNPSRKDENIISTSSAQTIGGCAAINGPIPFRGTNIYFDGVNLGNGMTSGSYGSTGTITIGGTETGSQYTGESQMGSMRLNVSSSQPNYGVVNGYNYGYGTGYNQGYGYAQYASIEGTLYLSSQTQLDIMNRMGAGYGGYGGYGGGYNYGGYGYGGSTYPGYGYNSGYGMYPGVGGYGGNTGTLASMCVSNVSMQLRVSQGRVTGYIRAFIGNSNFSTDIQL